MSVTPLYGYDSQENSYLVEDYPYGRLRCQIRFWMEHKENKGFRFCSVTQNPKNGVWNKPKTSTYAYVAGCMYLDEKNHVHWSGLNEYSSAEDSLEFCKKFPKAINKFVSVWALGKINLLDKLISGKTVFTINGVPQPDSDSRKEERVKELEIWKEVLALSKLS